MNKLISLSIASLLIVFPGLILAAAPSHTAFIEGKIAFEADPDRKGAYRYIKKGVDLGDYDRVAIAPIEVWVHPDSPYQGIQASSFKVITDEMRQVLSDTLEPDYPVVNKAGPKTLGLRLAITGVKLKKKKRGFLSFTPIGLVATAAQDEVASRTTLSDAVIEAELLDAKTGERLGVLVDQSLATEFKGETQSWDEIKSMLTFYAQRFKARLDKAHAK